MDIFCKIIKGEIPSKKIYEDDVVIVILDVNPISNGHSLIIPKKHYLDLFDIDSDTLNHIMKISKKIGNLLYNKLGCDGLTITQNSGSVEEVKHFHMHLIPAYIEEKKIELDEALEKILN